MNVNTLEDALSRTWGWRLGRILENLRKKCIPRGMLHIRRSTWSHHSSTTSLAVSPPPISITRLPLCSGTKDLSVQLWWISPSKSLRSVSSRARLGSCTLPLQTTRNVLVNTWPFSHSSCHKPSFLTAFFTAWSKRIWGHNLKASQ